MNVIPPADNFTGLLFDPILPYAVASLMLLLSVEFEYGNCVTEGVTGGLGSRDYSVTPSACLFRTNFTLFLRENNFES